MRIEKIGPGLAFWRAKAHGWDVWGYGMTIEWDWFHWGLGLRLIDFDGAPGFHFDNFVLLGVRVPFLYVDIGIIDRKN